MIWVSLGEFPGWTSSRGSAGDVNRLASFLGLMSESNSDQGPDLMQRASDRTTAERFGRRISQLAHRWTRPCFHKGSLYFSTVLRPTVTPSRHLTHTAQHE